MTLKQDCDSYIEYDRTSLVSRLRELRDGLGSTAQNARPCLSIRAVPLSSIFSIGGNAGLCVNIAFPLRIL